MLTTVYSINSNSKLLRALSIIVIFFMFEFAQIIQVQVHYFKSFSQDEKDILVGHFSMGNFGNRANFRLPVFGGFSRLGVRRIQKTQN